MLKVLKDIGSYLGWLCFIIATSFIVTFFIISLLNWIIKGSFDWAGIILGGLFTMFMAFAEWIDDRREKLK